MLGDIYLTYLVSGAIILVCILISAWASARVHRTYRKYSAMPTAASWTGSDTARMLLERGGAAHVQVVRGRGRLTDNFDPRTMSVTLSESTYDATSVAAVAVAAHGVGHGLQRAEGAGLYRLRSFLVPVTNIGTMLALPLVVVGIILEWVLATTEIGNAVVFIGVCLYGLSTLFTLVTLPVELNASRRAKAMLAETGVLTTREEQRAAAKVLSAAAMTYFASLLVSLLYFLRFLLYVLAFSRRGKD